MNIETKITFFMSQQFKIANNHPVEDSVGRNDTSPHPRFKTQALLQLCLFCVFLRPIFMEVVITVANVEVHIFPPVLY